MSDLGYQNNAQAGLTPCYDDLSSYTESLYRAVSTPYAPYEAMGIKDAAGNWQQLNTNVLQIENEYYSNIRPKRVTATGERPLQALRARGINTSKCAASISTRSCRWASASTKHASSTPSFCSARWPTALPGRWRVRRGHRQLPQGGQGGPTPRVAAAALRRGRPARQWAGQLLDEIAEVAALLDRSHGDSRHAEALAEQRAKVADSSLTPSARVLEQLRTNGESFSQFAMRQTLAHADYFRSQAPSANELQQFETAARQSLAPGGNGSCGRAGLRQLRRRLPAQPDALTGRRAQRPPAGFRATFRRSSNSAGSCTARPARPADDRR